MPLQEFSIVDYWGPVVVAIIFAVILFLLSFFIINWFCITKRDDFTVFEKVILYNFYHYYKTFF